MLNTQDLNVFSLLRTYSKTSSINSIRENGGENVLLLGAMGIENLVQEAVSNSIKETALQITPEDSEGFYGFVLERFLKVLDNNDAVKDVTSEIAVEIVRLREKSRFQPKETPPAEVKANAPTIIQQDLDQIDADLSPDIKKLFKISTQSKTANASIIKSVNNWLQEEKKKIIEDVHTEQENRIHILKARIAKLRNKLKETEFLVASDNPAGTLDTGVASEFRDVQGLGPTAANYQEKKAALQELFKVNLDLRENVKLPIKV